MKEKRISTCDPVSIELRGELVIVLQKRMHLSAVPPPLANKPLCIKYKREKWKEKNSKVCIF
jgi:hypothetical protein